MGARLPSPSPPARAHSGLRKPPPPPPLEGPRPPRGLPARRTPARTERESRAAPRARFRLVLRLQATDTLHRTTAGKHKAGIEAAFQPPDLSPQPILIALVARKTNTNSCRTSLCYRIATLQDNVNNLKNTEVCCLRFVVLCKLQLTIEKWKCSRYCVKHQSV